MSAKKYIPSPGGLLPNGTIYEQIQVGKGVQYAVKTAKGIVIEPFLTVGEHVVYQPIAPSPWLLPPRPEDYGSLITLWQEIRDFVEQHVDFEDDKLYDVYVAWVLMTWIPEKFDSTSYLHFHGPRNSGKTRGLDILNYICFRPLLSPSASGATIFRALDAFWPTFLLDEFEMYEQMKESKAEVIAIINSGYKRGQVVLRMTGMKEGTPMIKGFKVFGPKALSSIEPLPNALSSRCIRFPMTKTFRKVERLIRKKEAEVLRGKLLWWRFSHDLEEAYEDIGNPIDLPDGRLIEMYYPLEMIAPTPDLKKRILDVARGQHNASTEEDRATLEAAIFTIVLDLLDQEPRFLVPQHEIRTRYNAGVGVKEMLSRQKVAATLKTLNFGSKHNSSTRKQDATLTVDLIERRKNRYVMADEMPRVDEILRKLKGLVDKQSKLHDKAGGEGGEKLHVTINTVDQQVQHPIEGVEDAVVHDGTYLIGKPTEPTVSTDLTDVTDDAVEYVQGTKITQEELKRLLNTMMEYEDPVSANELATKMGASMPEINRLIQLLVRDGTVFSPRIGYWKAAT